MSNELTVGQIVEIRGRVLRIVGFDPMGVSERKVQLVDCMNGRPDEVPVDEVERAARASAAAA
ncbi:MAG TPA: hypothetical protein VGN06_00810 [Gaiellaceae bacterium]|jgi:hypothetical protein